MNHSILIGVFHTTKIIFFNNSKILKIMHWYMKYYIVEKALHPFPIASFWRITFFFWKKFLKSKMVCVKLFLKMLWIQPLKWRYWVVLRKIWSTLFRLKTQFYFVFYSKCRFGTRPSFSISLMGRKISKVAKIVKIQIQRGKPVFSNLELNHLFCSFLMRKRKVKSASNVTKIFDTSEWKYF